MFTILNKANAIRDFGDEGLSVGGRLGKGEIPEVKFQAHKESKAADWELAAQGTREGAVGVFTGGNMDEKGQVGGGWQVEGVGGGKQEVGVAAAVWGGDVLGVKGGLKLTPAESRLENPSPIGLPSDDCSRAKGKTDW